MFNLLSSHLHRYLSSQLSAYWMMGGVMLMLTLPNVAAIAALDAERTKLVTKGADLNKRLALISGTGGDQSNLMERNDSKKRQRS